MIPQTIKRVAVDADRMKTLAKSKKQDEGRATDLIPAQHVVPKWLMQQDHGMAVKPTTKTLTAVKAAELVENVEGDSLRLDYITELDDGAAEALAKFEERELDLNSLRTLSDKSVEALAQFEGDHLSLKAPMTLSDKAAEALAKFKGDLYWLHDKNDELKTQVNRFRK